MIRFFIILFAAIMMFAAGRFVFHRPEQKVFQLICYGLAAVLALVFFYIMVLAIFLGESI